MSRDVFSMLKRVKKPSKDGVTRPDQRLLADLKSFPARWRITGTHLVTNVPSHAYVKDLAADGRVKVAAFDLDGTLVDTKSGSKFARGADDWRWFNNNVVSELKKLIEKKYILVIFTNQGGMVATKTSKSYLNFTKRVNSVVESLKSDDPIELLVFASPKRPKSDPKSSEELHNLMRKPSTGMWKELEKYLKDTSIYIDMESSLYIGDAAGREGDFSDSDKQFAVNIGLMFKTPEQIF